MVWGFCYRCLLILFVCLFNFLSSSHDLFILLCQDHLPIFFAPIIWISYLYFLLLCLPLEFFLFVLYRFVLVGCLLTCLVFETETLVVQSSLELPGWPWTDLPVFITQGLGWHLYTTMPGCSHSVGRILYFLSLAPGWLLSWLVRDFVVVVPF